MRNFIAHTIGRYIQVAGKQKPEIQALTQKTGEQTGSYLNQTYTTRCISSRKRTQITQAEVFSINLTQYDYSNSLVDGSHWMWLSILKPFVTIDQANYACFSFSIVHLPVPQHLRKPLQRWSFWWQFLPESTSLTQSSLVFSRRGEGVCWNPETSKKLSMTWHYQGSFERIES